ncbi:MAG: hypothetical protein K2R93_03860 [Gemmatimonadaceae bacterium]|nr:hypothetical protein [Gemmatimonadaceae bacterium]
MRRERVPLVLAGALLLGAAPSWLLAQPRETRAGLGRASPSTKPALTPAPSASPASWWAPLASLAVPGAGQSMLKQPRSVAYVAAEAFLVIQYLAAERDGNRDRGAYRQLASEVARKPYGGTRIGTWDYYESMEKFLESGAYSKASSGAVEPETDPTTYNGARWLLARQNYWANPNVTPARNSPEYQRALAFYLASAVTDEYRWSWRDQQLQQDVYRQTIRSANRSYQRATTLLGVVAMNHLSSLIDAYISVRVRRFGTGKEGRTSGLRLDGVTTDYAATPTGQSQLLIGLRAR